MFDSTRLFGYLIVISVYIYLLCILRTHFVCISTFHLASYIGRWQIMFFGLRNGVYIHRQGCWKAHGTSCGGGSGGEAIMVSSYSSDMYVYIIFCYAFVVKLD